MERETTRTTFLYQMKCIFLDYNLIWWPRELPKLFLIRASHSLECLLFVIQEMYIEFIDFMCPSCLPSWDQLCTFLLTPSSGSLWEMIWFYLSLSSGQIASQCLLLVSFCLSSSLIIWKSLNSLRSSTCCEFLGFREVRFVTATQVSCCHHIYFNDDEDDLVVHSLVYDYLIC